MFLKRYKNNELNIHKLEYDKVNLKLYKFICTSRGCRPDPANAQTTFDSINTINLGHRQLGGAINPEATPFANLQEDCACLF